MFVRVGKNHRLWSKSSAEPSWISADFQGVCIRGFLMQGTSIGKWNSRIWDGSGASHGEWDEKHKLDQTWSVRRLGEYKVWGGLIGILHTYLEGVIPFMYRGYGP